MIIQEITAIILTKSAKHRNYCVAGIDCSTGKFVRFVSEDEVTDGALTGSDLKYWNGDFQAVPLHLVKVKVKAHLKGIHQTENYLIDRSQKWTFIRKVSLADVLELHAPEIHKNIFGNDKEFAFSFNLINIDYSLMLISVNNLKLYTDTDSGKTKAAFDYNNKHYTNFSVTDNKFFNFEEDEFFQAFLVISISDKAVPAGMHYKFIAKIFA
ncbi:MAG: hypothetical protein K2K80_02390 [Clostridia bacterium]|nr:hypothetical protein [Clostridia bacterium]